MTSHYLITMTTVNNRFEFRPTDSEQVLKLLNKLDKSKGAGDCFLKVPITIRALKAVLCLLDLNSRSMLQ